jgi:phosphoribosylanthranilate isomerase
MSTATQASTDRHKVRIRTKICGVTTVDDALLAIDHGADLIGLNFYPASPRYVTPERADELVRDVQRVRPEHGREFTGAADRLRWVGVFVDESAEIVARTAEIVGLDLVQLHGDETPEFLTALGAIDPGLPARVIKVFRVPKDLLREEVQSEMERRMEPWRALGVWGFLVDTHHPSLYGGTGESWDFASLSGPATHPQKQVQKQVQPRLLLAGGLHPGNVRAALEAEPWGIDLCSGIESEPGRKDPHLMRRLFEEIHHGKTRTAT